MVETGLCDGGRPPGFEMAGRTDAGVSALGQVFAVDVENVKGILRRLNSRLPPNIGVWAVCPVHADFSPRRDALWRTYAYFLYAPDLDTGLAGQALEKLCGEHDFRHLCRRDKERATRGRIDAACMDGTGPLYRLSFTAPRFLWQQVRRMVRAVHLVGCGGESPEWLDELLGPDYAGQSVAPAPAGGLYLKEVEYGGLDWEVDDYALSTVRSQLNGIVEKSSVRTALLQGLLKGLDGGI